MNPTPGPGSKVRQTFIDVVLETLGVERTPEHEQVCDLILFRMVRRGVVFLPLPPEVADKLASSPGADIPDETKASTGGMHDGAADVQGGPSAQGR